MSASKSPCAACKFLRRKCTQECVFAPYFPPDNPQKFANVHKVFGASNVAKLLNELNTSQREDAVNSLEYEAKARLHDPVHGCVGLISVLQHRLHATRLTLEEARKDLAVYLGPQAMLPILSPAAIMQQGHHMGNPSAMQQQAMVPMMGIPTAPNQQLVIRDTQNPTHQHQQQQFFENQAQLAAAMAARDAQYEMFRGYEQQQHHQHIQQQQQHQEEIARFNAGFDGSGGSVTATGYNQIPAAAGGMSPSLAPGTFDDPYQIHQAKQENHGHGHGHSLQEQLLFQPPPQQEQPQQAPDQKSGSEDVKSVALSC